jgi:hypothetical protein
MQAKMEQSAEALIESNNIISTVAYVTDAVARLRREMRLGNEWSVSAIDTMTWSELSDTANRLRKQLDDAAAVREIITKLAETIRTYRLDVKCTSDTPYPITKTVLQQTPIEIRSKYQCQTLHDSQEAWTDFVARVSSTRMIMKMVIAPRLSALASL